MLGHARELERRGMLIEARQKALEAREFKAVFQPDEDSPDAMLLSLQATCDRQIVAVLQQAVRHGNDAADAERFVKAQEQILAAQKLAHAFQLDTGKIIQTQRHLHSRGWRVDLQARVEVLALDASLSGSPPTRSLS